MTLLQYPKDLVGGDTFMMFSPNIHISTKDNAASQTGAGKKIENKKEITNSDGLLIYLYHPAMAKSNSQIEWEAGDQGILGRVISRVTGIVTQKSLMAAYQKIEDGSGSLARDIFLAGRPQDILNARRGAIQNPKKTMFFKGIGFREFQFTFDFVAKSKEESKTIRDIIVAFKKYSYPKYAGLELAYPPIWDIVENVKGVENQKFKPCFVTAVNTDMAPDQVLANFDDGSPVHIKLEISFKESEILTQKDFDGVSEGYGY